jgi:hypothetical protein
LVNIILQVCAKIFPLSVASDNKGAIIWNQSIYGDSIMRSTIVNVAYLIEINKVEIPYTISS